MFLSRYLFFFTRYISLYNSIMKLVFIGTSIAIVWYIRYHKVVKQTYNKDEDTFKHYFLILPSFFLALLIPHAFNTVEVWMFLSSSLVPFNKLFVKDNKVLTKFYWQMIHFIVEHQSRIWHPLFTTVNNILNRYSFMADAFGFHDAREIFQFWLAISWHV